VGHLEIRDPIPVAIDFSNLKVNRWSIGETDPEDRYLELLEHASEFKSANYTQIENTLRNQGSRDKAEEVHRAMRRMEQWRLQNVIPTALMLLHSLIGYGTKRAPVMGFMLVWFLFTVLWVASEASHVLALTPDAEATLLEIESNTMHPEDQGYDVARDIGQLRARLEDTGGDVAARLGRGVALAARYHVPIIGHDLWPYQNPRGSLMWFYTSFVEIVHWILWPLLLASLIPTLIPRREE
jgi:hypothetical protein